MKGLNGSISFITNKLNEIKPENIDKELYEKYKEAQEKFNIFANSTNDIQKDIDNLKNKL